MLVLEVPEHPETSRRTGNEYFPLIPVSRCVDVCGCNETVEPL